MEAVLRQDVFFAMDSPAEADIVTGVPESGNASRDLVIHLNQVFHTELLL